MRRLEPWYRASKGAWFVQFGDKQVRLTKGPKDETIEAYFKLIAQRALPLADNMLTSLFCDLFPQTSFWFKDWREARGVCQAKVAAWVRAADPNHVIMSAHWRLAW